MSKRPRENTERSVKRLRQCRKRDRPEEVFERRQRIRYEQETLQEASAILQTPAQHELEALKKENAYLRHVLGKVGRIGFILKAERDYLLQQQQFDPFTKMHPVVTVQ